jgi:hypothetical protein
MSVIDLSPGRTADSYPSGIVPVPLVGGLVLATRDDVAARRAAAAGLLAGHPELTTIGVATRAGGFVIGDGPGGYEVGDGRQLAASLSTVPLYGSEVRMWINWPSGGAEQNRFEHNVSGLARSTGAVVWVPRRGARIEILDSCRDLSAVSPGGEPAGWRAYTPPGAGALRFESDVDGRLSPVGQVRVARHRGVPLVSVEPARLQAARGRYARLVARRGLFCADLTFLTDGRWAVHVADSGPHALSPGLLQRNLRTAGWQGEDLLLLGHYPASAAQGIHRFGARLVAGLRAEVWMLPPDADFVVVDGMARAVDIAGRPAAWQRLDAGGGPGQRWLSSDGMLVAPTRTVHSGSHQIVSPGDGARSRFQAPAAGSVAPRAAPPSAPLVPAPLVPAPQVPAPQVPVSAPSAPPAPARDVGAPDDSGLPTGRTPRLEVSRDKLRHGIYWLADRPRVNTEPVDLYVVAAVPPAQAVEVGLPTPHLFAVGQLRPPAAGTLAPEEHLLLVRVAPGGAVDMSSIDVHVPPAVQLLLENRGEAYLLPGGLLGRTQVVGGYGLDAAGRLAERTGFPGGRPLTLRYSGARHGVDGLPGDVPRWPRSAAAIAFALLPGPGIASADGALALLPRSPRVRPGHRLLRLRVPHRRAVDIRAARRQNERLATVRSSVDVLLQRKIELILPYREYDQVQVIQVLAPGRWGWRTVGGVGNMPLEDVLRKL